MIFKRLEFKNYKTYYGFQDINLNVTNEDIQNGKNIILFGGLNGAGKTTILKAVRYILFGERGMSTTEIKRVFSNTINDTFFDEGGRECAIALTFSLNSNEEYRIEVKWLFDHLKKKVHETRSIQQLGKLRMRDIPVTDINAFNRFIDRYIPYNAAPFFIFDGEEIRELITKQDANSMKMTIHKITGLDRIKKLLEDLNKVKLDLQKKIATATNSATVSKLQDQLNIQLEEKSKVEVKVDKYRSEISKIRLNIKELKEIRNQKLSANSSSREKLVKKKANIDSRIEQTKNEIDKLFESDAIKILLALKVEPLKKSISNERMLKEKLLKRSELLQPYHDFMNQLLNQKIDPPLDGKQLVQIKNLGESIWLKEENSSPIERKELHDLNSKDYRILANYPIKNTDAIVNLYKSLESLNVESEALDSQILDAPELVDTDNEDQKIMRLSQREGELLTKNKAANNKLNTINDEVTSLRNKLTRSTKNSVNTDEVGEKLNYITRLTDYYEEYLAEVTKLKLDKIEFEFKAMLMKLFRKSGEFTNIVFDKNTYSIRLFNDKSQEVSIYDRSAGEMQLISSSFIWALIKTSELELPIVIDTPLGRLDSIHRNHLVRHYYTNLSKQVIILSTDTEVTKEYVEIMEEYSLKQYQLDYDQSKKYTIIRKGYFDLVKVN